MLFHLHILSLFYKLQPSYVRFTLVKNINLIVENIMPIRVSQIITELFILMVLIQATPLVRLRVRDLRL